MELNAEAEESGDPNKRSNDSMSDTTTGSNEATEIANVTNISGTIDTGVVTCSTDDDVLKSSDLLENSDSTSGKPPKKLTAKQYKKWLRFQAKIEKKYGKSNESLNPRVIITRLTVDNTTVIKDDSSDTTQTDVAAESSDTTQTDVVAESSDTTQTDVVAESSNTTQTGVAPESSDTTTTSVAAKSSDTRMTRVAMKSNDTTHTGVAAINSDTTQTGVVAKNSDTKTTGVAAKNSDTTLTGVAMESNDTTHTGVAGINSDTTQTGVATKNSDTKTTGVAAKNSDTTTTGVAAKSSDTTITRVAMKSNDTTHTGVAAINSDTTQTGVAAKNSDTKTTGVAAKNSDTTMTGVAMESNDTTQTDVVAESSNTTQTGVAPESSDTTTTSVAAKSSDTRMTRVAMKSNDTTHTGVAAINSDTTQTGVAAKNSDTKTTGVAAKNSDTTMTGVAMESNDTTHSCVAAKNSDTSQIGDSEKSSDTTTSGVASKSSDTTMTDVAAKSSDTTQTGITAKGSDTMTGVAAKISDKTQIDASGSSETMQIDDEEEINDIHDNSGGEAQRKFTAKHPQFHKRDTHIEEQVNIVAGTSACTEQCKALNPKVLIIPMDLPVIGKDKPVSISSSIKDKENNSDPKVEISSREPNVFETSHPDLQEDTQLQEKLQIKVINTSSVVVESVSNTTDENIDKPALNGVQKFLQLMNLLNKNPEKCKKWLQHQELQKQKLRDKYKEPIIYSTVKQISLSQIGINKSSDERRLPKVQNSLDLLNILYLNPDKCTNWLIKQEALRKQHGKKYQQPVIYSTVRLIAADHLKQANAKKSSITKPISDNAKDTVHHCTNESKHTKVTTDSLKTATSNNESSSNTEKKYKIPKFKSDNKRQLIGVDTITVPDVSKIVPSVSKTISVVSEIVDTDKKIAKTSEGGSNTEGLPGRTEDQVFLLFPPNVSFKTAFKMLGTHMDLRRKMNWSYKLPRFNYNGRRLPFGSHKTSKDIFRIPLNDSTFKIIKCQPELEDYILFDWMFKQLLQIESLNSMQLDMWKYYNDINTHLSAEANADISSAAGNVLPPANNLIPPSETLSSPLFPCAPDTDASTPAAPAEPVMSLYTHTGGQSTSVIVPPALVVDSPASVLDPQPLAAYQPPSAVGPSASTVGTPSPSVSTVGTPSPSATNTSAKNPTPPRTKPLDKTSNPPIICSNIPLPSDNPTAPSTNTPTMKSSNSTTTNINKASKKNHSKDFDFANSNQKVAFCYKGKNVFYPKHVDSAKSRKKWIDKQLYIHKQIGNEYCPPEYDEKGVLIPRKRVQLTTAKTTASTIDSAIKGTSIKQCILDTMESHLSQILLPPEVARINQLKNIVPEGKCAFDKFGMRINVENKIKSEPTKRTYEKSTSIKSTNKSKPAIKLSDAFSSDGKKIQLEKVKINMKLKKDEKSTQKKEREEKVKEKSKSPTPVKKTSTNNSSGSEHLSPYKRTKYEFTPFGADELPPRLTGVPRDMASKWFGTPPSSATQPGTQQVAAAYSPVTYPGFPVSVRQLRPPPLNRPPAPVMLPHTPVPAPPAPVPMPTMHPPPPVISAQGIVPRAPIASVLGPERERGKGKLSAFERLGPPMEAKKPKLTINLMFTKDEKNEVIREVVEEHVPVYLRHDILSSRDIIVKEYLKLWPWSRPVKILNESSHSSRDLLLDEYEMSSCYNSKSSWIKVSVSRYPPTFKKDDVLDLLLKYVDKREFIPCFIEFKQEECIFLLNRSEDALTYLHKNGLVAVKDGVKLYLTVSQTNLTLDNLRFYKGAVFKAKLNNCYEANTNTLNLSAFQMQPDNSHFMYFPLNISYNQIFILNVIKAILPWNSITTLDLSGNRLKSVYFLNLAEHFPSLRVLNLSNNLLPTVSTLTCFKGIPLNSLYLEGNPLCLNFIEKDHYLEVVKLIFPRLVLLDGEKINSKVEIKRNFSVSSDAQELVNSFLEIVFALTDSNDRLQMESLYAENAVFSITCRTEMKRKPMYHNLKEFYMWCRSLNESINPLDPLEGTIVGGPKIVRYFSKWPMVVHDPHTFTVDVMHHTENATILKVTGLFKIPAESLSQEEPIAEFSRTFILTTEDGAEYKIVNDMMYISDATQERLGRAFQVVTLQHTNVDSLSLKFESPPDDELKDKFTEIVMQLTGLQRKLSQRCLDLMDWNLRKALEYFIQLEKLGTTGTLDF